MKKEGRKKGRKEKGERSGGRFAGPPAQSISISLAPFGAGRDGDERSIACELISFIEEEEEEDTNQWILMNGIKKKEKENKISKAVSKKRIEFQKPKRFQPSMAGNSKKVPPKKNR